MATEFIRGALEGTLHRLDNGHRTGVMWGPSVEGAWYASRAQIGDGETFKFTEEKFARAFLAAELAPQMRVFTGHLRYGFITAKARQHPLWHHTQDEAHAAAGETAHQLIAEPCGCSQPPPNNSGRGRAPERYEMPEALAAMDDEQQLGSAQIAELLGVGQKTVNAWWRSKQMESWPAKRVKANSIANGKALVTTAAEVRAFIERRNNA